MSLGMSYKSDITLCTQQEIKTTIKKKIHTSEGYSRIQYDSIRTFKNIISP
jgi:hypothetical protein